MYNSDGTVSALCQLGPFSVPKHEFVTESLDLSQIAKESWKMLKNTRMSAIVPISMLVVRKATELDIILSTRCPHLGRIGPEVGRSWPEVGREWSENGRNG